MSQLMKHHVKLALVSGEEITIELEPPGNLPSSYFAFTKEAGNLSVWPFVMRLLSAGRQPICNLSGDLYRRGLKSHDVERASLSHLLQREGYAFGVVWDASILDIQLDRAGLRTFLFVRDPRDVIARAHAPSLSIPIADFLASPAALEILNGYGPWVEFLRPRRHVTIVRYEDLFFGWSRLAAELTHALQLPVPLEMACQMAASTAIMARSQSMATFRQRYDDPEIAILEAALAVPMAVFGYAPDQAPCTPFLKCQAEFLRAVNQRQAIARLTPLLDPDAIGLTEETEPRSSSSLGTEVATADAPKSSANSGTLYELDPELMIRLKPNASIEALVLGRRVVMEVDASGCRPVVGQPVNYEKVLAAYGCSCTYGIAIPVEETFCSLLQSMFPRWRVENHGVGGYSGTQNLIQLQRDLRWSSADYVTFCWIHDHLRRNIAEYSYLHQNMRTCPRDRPQRPWPRAALDGDGQLEFRSVLYPRFDLFDLDMSDFRPDPYYSNLVCAAILRRADELVRGSGGHFFVTTLRGTMPSALLRMLQDAGIPVVDATLSGRQYSCLPDDAHPNGLANEYYAEKIREYLVNRERM